ncbi:MAG: DJ-1/PfpI family protein [Lachnospiraceae bacterium]|nr:DJ-1/PfpI family protein [Lachnospiraceae bacterium]
MKKAVVFLADGFEEIEGLTPVDMLRRAGVEVTTVSISGTTDVLGGHDIAVKADKLFEDVNYDEMDMLILPGGGKGTENLESCEKLLNLLKKADSDGKLIAAICAAPRVLGKLGLLKGKRAACFPGNEKFLEGAETAEGEKAVISGRFITARGMGAAVEFGAAVIEALLGREKAEEILKVIQY